MIALIVLLLWTTLYLYRGLSAHFSLDTTAYDLSVFDYALWSLAHGGSGHVPFMGHSIFSHHFMPILYAIVPLHVAMPSAITLIVLQVLAIAAAGYVYYRLQCTIAVHAHLALLLMVVFLISRRSHSATSGFFYPESLQPLLTFACVLFWLRTRWVPYWLCVVALLMTKEDAPVYLGTFAAVAVLADRAKRRAALATGIASMAWFFMALMVAIPTSRTAEGLPPENPFIDARYASQTDEGHTVEPDALANRVVSTRTAATIGNVLLSAGLLPLLAPQWIVPAVPGVIANVMAREDAMQSGLVGHYAFPILPWLFVAAAVGVQRWQMRYPRVIPTWCVLLLVASLVDSPAIRGIANTRVDPDARTARAQLLGLPFAGTVVAQANLVPHIPYVPSIYTTGGGAAPPLSPDLVIVTTVGGTWPFTRKEVEQQVDAWRHNAMYEEIAAGPLFAYRRR